MSWLFFSFFACCVALVLVVLFNVILAAPGVTAVSKPCNECPLNYEPICAGPPGTTNDKDKKSFGNECVMEKYNCEKNESKFAWLWSKYIHNEIYNP